MNSYNRSQYPLFNDLPSSLRVLYTMVLLILGLGYLFAMIQIFESHAGRDGESGLSIKDIQIAYSGSKADSRLEVAVKGPMSSMLTEQQAAAFIGWVRGGALKLEYESEVAPVIKQRCLACHNGTNPHVPKLTNYDELKALAVLDTGVSIGTLVRVSHIHLFGLTFIFAFTGLVFSHAHIKRCYVKNIVIMVPFVAIFLDIMSWWLTKVSESFAIVVVIGGALMGLSFAFQWCVSIYQLWFYKCPSDEVCEP